MRIEELVLEGITIIFVQRYVIKNIYRLQVVPSTNTDHWMGFLIQRHYWSQWIRKV